MPASSITTEQQEDSNSPPGAPKSVLIDLFPYGKIKVKTDGDAWAKGEEPKQSGEEIHSGVVAGDNLNLDISSKDTMQQIHGVGERNVSCVWDRMHATDVGVRQLVLVAYVMWHGRIAASVTGGGCNKSLTASAEAIVSLNTFGKSSDFGVGVQIVANKTTMRTKISAEGTAATDSSAEVEGGSSKVKGKVGTERGATGRLAGSMEWETTEGPTANPINDSNVEAQGMDSDTLYPDQIWSKPFIISCNGSATGDGNGSGTAEASVTLKATWFFSAVLTLVDGTTRHYNLPPNVSETQILHALKHDIPLIHLINVNKPGVVKAPNVEEDPSWHITKLLPIEKQPKKEGGE